MMYGVPEYDAWRERAAATKKRRSDAAIREAARGLFEEHGFDEVTVEEIVIAAGVGPAAVYQTIPATRAWSSHCLHLLPVK